MVAHPAVVENLLVDVKKNPHTLELVIRILASICLLNSPYGLSSMAVSGLLTSYISA